MNWKIVKTDGNPTAEGEYFVVLTHPKECVVIDNRLQPTDNTSFRAWTDMRFFGKRDPQFTASWAMWDQDPEAGPYWQEQSGSLPCESVYAWLDASDLKMPRLPEGVEWEGGEPSAFPMANREDE